MEWLIYFGIIIAIAIFSNYSEQKDKEKLVARLADIPKLVITAEETLFGEEDNLKGRPCFEVKMKGWINHQIEKKLTLHLFIHDNTEVEDNSYGMPLLSTLEVLSEEGSRVFKYQLDIYSKFPLSKGMEPVN